MKELLNKRVFMSEGFSIESNVQYDMGFAEITFNPVEEQQGGYKEQTGPTLVLDVAEIDVIIDVLELAKHELRENKYDE